MCLSIPSHYLIYCLAWLTTLSITTKLEMVTNLLTITYSMVTNLLSRLVDDVIHHERHHIHELHLMCVYIYGMCMV